MVFPFERPPKRRCPVSTMGLGPLKWPRLYFLNRSGSTPMVPFWGNRAPPSFESILVGIESDVHWGYDLDLTHSQIMVVVGHILHVCLLWFSG